MLRWWLLLVPVVLALYYSSGYFVIYNNDAYVSADVVQLATGVSGIVEHVPVVDNQRVGAGALLLSLREEPFLFALQAASGALDRALAEQASLSSQREEARAVLEIAAANETLAAKELARYEALYQQGDVSREFLDERDSRYTIARAALVQQQEAYAIVEQKADVYAAEVHRLSGERALADYDLRMSKLYAPAAGFVNNLKVYSGDYATAGSTLFGFVKKDSLRVVANIKETNLMMLHQGKAVWVYLSNYPWRLFRGKVVSIGRAVARGPVQENAALPFVEPVTSWIRYSYRIPVRIELVDMPPDKPLYVGVDARVVVFR